MGGVKKLLIHEKATGRGPARWWCFASCQGERELGLASSDEGLCGASILDKPSIRRFGKSKFRRFLS